MEPMTDERLSEIEERYALFNKFLDEAAFELLAEVKRLRAPEVEPSRGVSRRRVMEVLERRRLIERQTPVDPMFARGHEAAILALVGDFTALFDDLSGGG